MDADKNEVEQITGYLESKEMSVDINALISCYQNGLTFDIAKIIFEKNTTRYEQLVTKLQDPSRSGFAMFNAFQSTITGIKGNLNCLYKGRWP